MEMKKKEEDNASGETKQNYMIEIKTDLDIKKCRCGLCNIC